MISERNALGYIGGSDAARVHGGWETKTFREFWDERLTGMKTKEFSTIHTVAGNIMEGYILEAVGVDREYWNVFRQKEGTMAGINTDAFDGVIYHEAKNILLNEASKWVFGYSIPSVYMYQIQHGMYVLDIDEVNFHVCLVTPEEKENPFLVTDVKSKTHTFRFNRSYFDKTKVTMPMYAAFIEYLTECYNNKSYPTDARKKEIINSFNS